jgi:RHS repeat-associated protein
VGGVRLLGRRGQVLKVLGGTSDLAVGVLGGISTGDMVEVQAYVSGQATLALGTGNSVSSASASVTGWTLLKVQGQVPSGGALNVWLRTTDEAGTSYFDDVQARIIPPATIASGQPNLWPDPGMEAFLSYGAVQNGDVSISGSVTLEMDGSNREGLHALRVSSGSTYQRIVRGLTANAPYLFSIWKKPDGQAWQRETRALTADSIGSLIVSLSQAGLYDQAEIVAGTYPVLPEAWIPENRLGRVDWFITDHLGSTKLLIDQNGQHRFTGDDDPFGINLRSFGDKDSHRYTGQILDEEQGVYYYGARYYLPEIGRFLSTDPKFENHSKYSYAANMPIIAVDRKGEDWYLFYWKGTYGHVAIGVDAPKAVQEAFAKSNRGSSDSQVRIAGKWPAWAYGDKNGFNEAIFGSGVTGKIIGTKGTASLNSILNLPNKSITNEDAPPDVVIRIKTAYPQKEVELFKWIGEQVGSKNTYKGSLGACTDFVAEGARIMGTSTPSTSQVEIRSFLPMQTIRTPVDIFLDVILGANQQQSQPKQMEVIQGSLDKIDPPKI